MQSRSQRGIYAPCKHAPSIHVIYKQKLYPMRPLMTHMAALQHKEARQSDGAARK